MPSWIFLLCEALHTDNLNDLWWKLDKTCPNKAWDRKINSTECGLYIPWLCLQLSQNRHTMLNALSFVALHLFRKQWLNTLADKFKIIGKNHPYSLYYIILIYNSYELFGNYKICCTGVKHFWYAELFSTSLLFEQVAVLYKYLL